MKKFLTLILVFSNILGANTISDAFQNGYTQAKIEYFYYDIDKKDPHDAHANALGGYLKYTTDTKQAFFASVRFHTSNPILSNHNKVKTALFNNDKNGSALLAMSEAYLAYKTPYRVMKLGNLMLNTPMMNEDTTRIVPWSYRGFAYTGNAIKNTQVQLNHIRSIRNHTSDSYTNYSASGRIGDGGVTMLSFHHKNPDRYNLQIYYYYAPDLYSTLITQADYSISNNTNMLYCIGIQYFKSGNGGKYNDRENRNGGDDIDLLAAKISIDGDDWFASLNYSQNFGISGMVKGYGGLTKTYTTSMVANGRGNYKPETWMLKLRYDLPIKARESEVALTLTNTRVKDTRGESFDAYYFHFHHFFTKEASLYVRYEYLNYKKETTNDAGYFRVISSYEF
jgi:hypothetical protein